MDYGFAFLSAVDIHKDVVLAEKKVSLTPGCTTPR